MSIYTDEIFGPVLSVVRVDTYDEALELVNANPYGNGTAIFTNDGGAARRFQNEVQVGMVGINVPIPVPMAYYSFGGWKNSLFGDTHAHGIEGVHFFTRGKVVTSRWLDPSHGGLNLGLPAEHLTAARSAASPGRRTVVRGSRPAGGDAVRPVGRSYADHRHQRPVVEDRRHLLPGRRRRYIDWDGDGDGRLRRASPQRIDYLADLGVTCLWLMPFYPTADRDDGYDITDFYGVDPRLGSPATSSRSCAPRATAGMRVIVDLVVNHTSDRHPWFRAARSSTDSPYRDFYVWRADAPPDTPSQVVFPDEEDSIWQYDEKTGEWYLHHFYRTQPDLNIANPLVRDEIAKVDGLLARARGLRLPRRRGAVPARDRRRDAAEKRAFPDPHAVPARAAVVPRPPHRRRRPARRGEPPARAAAGVLRRRRRRRADHAVRLHHACRTCTSRWPAQDARPLARALDARPPISPDSQWATFVRNHDELTLDKLTDAEREEVFAAFGPEPEMQLYGRGLRRRLPPMLGRRPATDPDGLQPAVLAARHAGALLRRGDRHGREPRRRRAGWPSARRCSGPPAATAASRRARLAAAPAGGARTASARARQRRRPAPRPRLAAGVHDAADPRATASRPELGWATFTRSLDQPHATCWRTCARGTTAAGRRAQPRRRRRDGAAAARGLRRARTAWSTSCAEAPSAVDAKGRTTLDAGRRTATAGCAWSPRTAGDWSDRPAAGTRRTRWERAREQRPPAALTTGVSPNRTPCPCPCSTCRRCRPARPRRSRCTAPSSWRRTPNAWGYQRFWLAEHHSLPSVSSSSPTVMMAPVAAATSRSGSAPAAIMLPNHSRSTVAETFRVLEGLHPGRIDLGIGRAPGTDQLTAYALRRSREALTADDFPQQYGELVAYVDGFRDGHPFDADHRHAGRRPAAAGVDPRLEPVRRASRRRLRHRVRVRRPLRQRRPGGGRRRLPRPSFEPVDAPARRPSHASCSPWPRSWPRRRSAPRARAGERPVDGAAAHQPARPAAQPGGGRGARLDARRSIRSPTHHAGSSPSARPSRSPRTCTGVPRRPRPTSSS